MISHIPRLCVLGVLMFIAGASTIALAQTTSFTYQGKLTDTAAPAPANGSYDMQFTMWDQPAGGLQQPQPGPVTVTRTGVTVANGIFTVTLDFGVAALTGADRYLEISVKKAADPGYTTLGPRQQLTSSPYAVQTLNAAQLGGVAASQYVQTSDARLSDARPASSIDFNTAALTGNLPITHGGTGSSTQNFVDLSTTQSVSGAKTFSSSSNVFSGDGTALTLGQNSVSVFGTSSLIVSTATFTQVPGLVQTFAIPASGQTVFLVTTDGGFFNQSGNFNADSIVDVEIVADGAIVPHSGFERLYAINTASITFVTAYWHMSQVVALAGAGPHTVEVRARLAGGTSALVSAGDTTTIQGELTVTSIKQ